MATNNLIKLKQIDGGIALQNKVNTLEGEGHLYFKGTVADLTALNAVTGATEGQIYIVSDTGKKYVRHNDAWTLLSDVIDLSPYATTAYVDGEVDTLEQTISDGLDTKVDKVTGKGLSTNDFTNELKSKLEGLENYDDTALAGRVTDLESASSDNTSAIQDVADDLDAYKTSNDAAVALKANAADVYTKTEIDSKISSVFDYKGVQATAADLENIQSPKVGDVYFVSADSSEYVWNGTAWEKLGPVIDLSGFATTAAVNQGLANTLQDAKNYTDGEISTLSSTLSSAIGDVDDKADANAVAIDALEARADNLETAGTTASAILTLNSETGKLVPGSLTGNKIPAGTTVKAAVDSIRVIVNGVTYVEGTGAFTVSNSRTVDGDLITWTLSGFSLDANDLVEVVFVTEADESQVEP